MKKTKVMDWFVCLTGLVCIFLIINFVPLIKIERQTQVEAFIVEPFIGNSIIVMPIGVFRVPILSSVISINDAKKKSQSLIDKSKTFIQNKEKVEQIVSEEPRIFGCEPYFEKDTSLFNPRFESRVLVSLHDYLKRGLNEGEVVIQGWTLRYRDEGGIIDSFTKDYEIIIRPAPYPKIGGDVVYFYKK